MRQTRCAFGFAMLLLGAVPLACAQHAPASPTGTRVTLTVLDESSQPVANAEVTVLESGRPPIRVWTDYAGRCRYALWQSEPYGLHITASGFYPANEQNEDPRSRNVQVALTHERLLQQQVHVTASPAGIDTQEPSDIFSLGTPAIVNIPYPVSRDIRTLLPFFPGVIADGTGQVHVAGSEYWQTLYTLDGLDIRSPASGQLALRVSTDAVRSIDAETTRYPVQYGRSTGGVIAFSTGMGDNKFRFNATDFLPSFHDLNGIRFDKLVPRFTLSGPIVRNRAWFFDGLETEYDNIYITELPAGANTDELIRGSNLLKLQTNVGSANSVIGGLLFNDYHSPYDGISPLVPQQSTTKRDTIAWFPYVQDRQRSPAGALLETGFGVLRFRDGYEPHGDSPYMLTPETAEGSYFQNLVATSQREEDNATLFLPRRQWLGSHDIRGGIDLDHIRFGQRVINAPVNYLREDGTLLRRSVFTSVPPFTRHNAELGAYLEDHWNASLSGLLIEPGLRFDWDEIIRRPLFSPRIAVVYAPGQEPNTKISTGVGVYYEHTQLDYLEDALGGSRFDTYYNADGVTPSGLPQLTTFSYNQSSLHEARAINWSIGVEQKLPASIYAKANFIDKHVSGLFTYVNQSSPAALSGNYLLTSNRRDHDYAAEIEARRTFGQRYTLFLSYTHSLAHTNAAIDYSPTVSLLGPQQSGPLAWNVPNRVISWGWLPFDLPLFGKNWDFVYSLDWHNGFPITSINANYQVIGAVGSHSFPNYLSFSPGLEWRFHFHGYYFGLRGIMVNATNSQNPTVVNNNVDSPDYLMFSEPLGRALTARIRLIQSKK
ncbi:MAG TPA: TonB-dependent receptor [Acidobacteriaceae bacterium]|nr:TonB-dependent receptor [Acidobacteriaceae bacterium]